MIENKPSCKFLDNLIYVLVLFCLFILSYDQLWLQPEMEELRVAFNKLMKLSLCGIFVEFDILWTTAFLAAAPSIEKIRIEVMSLFGIFFTFGALVVHKF